MKGISKMKWIKMLPIFMIGLLLSVNVLGQSGSTIDVKGVVNDDFGPVAGANVVIKGTATGVSTNLDGEFVLKAPADATLVITFVGYQPLEVKVSTGYMNITLEEDSELLDEVVVIGYGSVRKKDATGSVSSVKVDEMNKGVVTSAQDMLVGKISGVSVTTNGGRPGEGASIRIRGGSSLSATNDPLVIIDGVIMGNELAGSSNPLSMVNPSDIESFTVLKDASATAIYGSRASNGVILITTKKGGSGKPQLSYNGNFSLSTRRNSMDVMTGDEYYRYVTEKFRGTQFAEKTAKLGKENTNWQDEIFQTAFATDHNLSILGSVKNMPYRASVGYTNEEGILKTSKMDRVTANFVLSPSFFNDHLKLDFSGKGMYSKTRFADTGAIGSAMSFDPTQPVKNGSKWGEYFTWTDSNGELATIAGKNPVAMLMLQNNRAHVRNFVGNVQADYRFHFLPDLRVNLNMGVDVATTSGTDFKNPYNPTAYSQNPEERGSRKKFENFRNNQLFEMYAQYVKDVKSIKSKFDIMGGYSWQHYKKSSDEFTHWVADDLSDLGLTGTADMYDFKEYYLVSFLGRFNYTLNDKYLLTFTLRDDGSSRFSKENRWALFPALALAWRIKDESFLKDVNALSDLKLRLGWGKTGQQDLGDDYYYPSMPSYLVGKDRGYYPMGYNENGTVYWVKQMKPKGYNPNLKWETTTTWNAGLDYGFLNERISGALDVYYRKTEDLLNREAPGIAGVSLAEQMPQNIGTLENKGIEFSIDARPIVTKDLEWHLGFNLAYNNSKITKLTATDDPEYKGQGIGDSGGDGGEKVQRYIKGYAPRTYYVYEQVYDNDGNPIEGVYVDRNNDGEISAEDLYLYKKPAADVFMGFNSKITYKNWDFGFNGRVSLGNYVYNSMEANNATITNESLWSNDIFFVNRPMSALKTNFTSKQTLSDYYVQNASFLKIDNITLGYTLDSHFKNKVRARVYATVQNPIVITKYSGLDPEVTDGIDYNFYPRPLRFLLGFNVNF